MNLTPKELQSIRKFIQKQTLQYTVREIGPEYLTPEDRYTLIRFGIDPVKLYSEKEDKLLNAYYLGKMASMLSKKETSKLTVKEIRNLMESNKMVDLTQRDKIILSNIKTHLFNDVTLMEGRIFKDVNQILSNDSLKDQRMLLKKEIKHGVEHKQTVQEIALSIAEKTGDWNRNFKIIVQWSITSAFENGKANQLFQYYGPDCLVYLQVHMDACDHCKKLYWVKPSKPRIFKLIDLMNNGNNVGLKRDEWKPVISPTHPFCRCQLVFYKKPVLV